jgi:Zinc finger C-x8-C-x5-C-x3-H type (and similar)
MTSPTGSLVPGMEGNLMKQQLFKTKVCRHFLSGRCKYSNDCTFAHSSNELQNRPDFRRTKICSKSECRDPQCQYAHNPDQVRDAFDVLCPAWLSGNCPNGIACPLSHNPTHLEELAVAYRIDSSDATIITPTNIYADVLLASLQLLTGEKEEDL